VSDIGIWQEATGNRPISADRDPWPMDDARIGRVVRGLRQRRGWRQVDLVARCGLSKSAISDLERGHVDRYTVHAVRKVFRALDGGVELYASWGGPGELDRLLDADHARLVEIWAERHLARGWLIWPEASFSIYGERGRIDLLAFHPPTGVLEVAECKTGIWDVQDTVGRLDAKIRLAPTVAAERGWRAQRVVGAFVIAEGRTARRRIEEHRRIFARYATRGAAVRAFIRDPRAAAGGLLAFITMPGREHAHRAGQRRVNQSHVA